MAKELENKRCAHPEDIPRVLELVKRAMASGIPYDYELRMRRFDRNIGGLTTAGLDSR